MNMINDGIGLLQGLAPVGALVALVLAGLALRNQGSALQNGRFGLWMSWAIVMLTLPQLLSWFSGFGMNVPTSAGGGTALLNVFKVDVTNFVNQFVVGYFAPVMAAWLVLKGVVEISEGRCPLYSVLGAMFLLAIASTQALLQGWNSGSKVRDCGRARRPLDVYRESHPSGRRRTGDYWRDLELYRPTSPRSGPGPIPGSLWDRIGTRPIAVPASSATVRQAKPS